MCKGTVVLDYTKEVSMRRDNVPTNFIEARNSEGEDVEMEDLSQPSLSHHNTYSERQVPFDLQPKIE